MKCPKCGFTNLDYTNSCSKCQRDLTEIRMLLGITAVKPGQGSFLAQLLPPGAESTEARLATTPETTPAPENETAGHPAGMAEKPSPPPHIDLSHIDLSDLEEGLPPELKDQPVSMDDTDSEFSQIDLSSLELEYPFSDEPGSTMASASAPEDDNKIDPEGLLEIEENPIPLEEMPFEEEDPKAGGDTETTAAKGQNHG